jgi:hypothetical protein
MQFARLDKSPVERGEGILSIDGQSR